MNLSLNLRIQLTEAKTKKHRTKHRLHLSEFSLDALRVFILGWWGRQFRLGVKRCPTIYSYIYIEIY